MSSLAALSALALSAAQTGAAFTPAVQAHASACFVLAASVLVKDVLLVHFLHAQTLLFALVAALDAALLSHSALLHEDEVSRLLREHPQLLAQAQTVKNAPWTPFVSQVYERAHGNVTKAFHAAREHVSLWLGAQQRETLSDRVRAHGSNLYTQAQAYASSLYTRAQAFGPPLYETSKLFATKMYMSLAQAPRALADAVHHPALEQAPDTAYAHGLRAWSVFSSYGRTSYRSSQARGAELYERVKTHAPTVYGHCQQHWPLYAAGAQAVIVLVIVLRSRTVSSQGKETVVSIKEANQPEASYEIPDRYTLHHHSVSPDTTLAEDERAPAPEDVKPVTSTPIKTNGRGTARVLPEIQDPVTMTNETNGATKTNGSNESDKINGSAGKPELSTISTSEAKKLPSQPAKPPSSATPTKTAPPSAFKALPSHPSDEQDDRSIFKRRGSLRKLRQSLRRNPSAEGKRLFGTRHQRKSTASLFNGQGDTSQADDSADMSAKSLNGTPRKNRMKRLSALVLGDVSDRKKNGS